MRQKKEETNPLTSAGRSFSFSAALNAILRKYVGPTWLYELPMSRRSYCTRTNQSWGSVFFVATQMMHLLRSSGFSTQSHISHWKSAPKLSCRPFSLLRSTASSYVLHTSSSGSFVCENEKLFVAPLSSLNTARARSGSGKHAWMRWLCGRPLYAGQRASASLFVHVPSSRISTDECASTSIVCQSRKCVEGPPQEDEFSTPRRVGARTHSSCCRNSTQNSVIASRVSVALVSASTGVCSVWHRPLSRSLEFLAAAFPRHARSVSTLSLGWASPHGRPNTISAAGVEAMVTRSSRGNALVNCAAELTLYILTHPLRTEISNFDTINILYFNS